VLESQIWVSSEARSKSKNNSKLRLNEWPALNHRDLELNEDLAFMDFKSVRNKKAKATRVRSQIV